MYLTKGLCFTRCVERELEEILSARHIQGGISERTLDRLAVSSAQLILTSGSQAEPSGLMVQSGHMQLNTEYTYIYSSRGKSTQTA